MSPRRSSCAARGASAIAALFSASCTVVYDPDDFALERDATAGEVADAELDSGPRADAAAPAVSHIEPQRLFEGVGSTGSAAAVVIHGQALSPDLEVRTDSDLVDIESVTVSGDGAVAAAAVRVSVEPDLEAETIAEAELEISQGEFSATEVLEIEGLEVLTLTEDKVVDEDTFADLYAEIHVDDAVELTGEHPARLRATGSITVSALLDASGGLDGVRSPGAGGCAGGGESEPGACRGGGDAGSGGGAGGGGGHGEDGASGGGDGSGDGGATAGGALVSPLGGPEYEPGDNVARGSGGGGGASNPLFSDGGAGGGGGGVVELSSWGDITLTERVTTDGGRAQSGSGLDCGGGGGGGSGGAILLRAGGSISAAGASLRARGGGGEGEDCDKRGGDGGAGRIRVDAPGSALPGDLDANPSPVRGPMWEQPLPAVVTSETFAVAYVAEPGNHYAASVDGVVTDTDLPDDGAGELSAELTPGLNEVCLLLPAVYDRELPESRNCRHIAYIP